MWTTFCKGVHFKQEKNEQMTIYKQIPLWGIKQENKRGAGSDGVLGGPGGSGHQDVSKAQQERRAIFTKWHQVNIY